MKQNSICWLKYQHQHKTSIHWTQLVLLMNTVLMDVATDCRFQNYANLHSWQEIVLFFHHICMIANVNQESCWGSCRSAKKCLKCGLCGTSCDLWGQRVFWMENAVFNIMRQWEAPPGGAARYCSWAAVHLLTCMTFCSHSLDVDCSINLPLVAHLHFICYHIENLFLII